MDLTASARPLCAIAGGIGILLLAGCTPAVPVVEPTAVADRVVAHVERTLALVPEVDCGVEPVDVRDGNEVVCEITDPETGVVSDAAVRIIALTSGDFDIHLSVHARTP